LSAFASGGLEPDVYVLLDVPADVAAVRLGVDRDRMESAGDDFHDRVRRGYAELACAEGWVVVDGTGTPDDVEQAVWAAVSGRLGW
jgi:dTMP kinase